MISSHTPPGSTLQQSTSYDLIVHAQRTASEWASGETRRSIALSRQKSPWLVDSSSTIDLSTPSPSDPPHLISPPTHANIKTSYLVISPILPPISTLLSLPIPFGKPATKDEYFLKGIGTSTLAVYGTNDIFTSISRLRKWSEKCMEKAESGKFQAVEVEGGDHFWVDNEHGTIGVGVLKEKVRRWVDGLGLSVS